MCDLAQGKKHMSKLARIPVEVKEGVSVAFEDRSIKITGPKGTLSFKMPEGIKVNLIENRLFTSLIDKKDELKKPLLGLTRAMIANMVTGVSKGFEKKLELSGVGYRAQASGNELTLSLGFSHPVKFKVEQGISFLVSDNVITVSGIDTDLVGNTAAQIRSIRPPEPYKGKGIRYLGEKIRRKAGKAVKALGAVTK